MKLYSAISPVTWGERIAQPGEVLDLPLDVEDAEIDALVAAGVIQEIDDGTNAAPAGPGVNQELRSAEIEAAVRHILDNGTPADLTKSGAPTVTALQACLGHEVTGKERDEALIRIHPPA